MLPTLGAVVSVQEKHTRSPQAASGGHPLKSSQAGTTMPDASCWTKLVVWAEADFVLDVSNSINELQKTEERVGNRWQDMRKETILCIFWIFTLKLESIVAIDLNFGVMILTSSRYTHKEFCATPASSLGGASAQVNCVQKSLFYASIWWFTVQYRRLNLASNTLDMWSKKPKLSTNQVGSLGLLWP